MTAILLVFLGSGLGGLMRYGVTLWAASSLGTGFPFGTLIVNATGGLVMGAVAGYLAMHASLPWAHDVRLLLATGILGGFTTFSAFSLDAVHLFEQGAAALAALYVVASVVLAIGGVVAGLALVRGLA